MHPYPEGVGNFRPRLDIHHFSVYLALASGNLSIHGRGPATLQPNIREKYSVFGKYVTGTFSPKQARADQRLTFTHTPERGLGDPTKPYRKPARTLNIRPPSLETLGNRK